MPTVHKTVVNISIMEIHDGWNEQCPFWQSTENFSGMHPSDWMRDAWEEGAINAGTFVVVEAYSDRSVRSAMCTLTTTDDGMDCVITTGETTASTPNVTRWPPRGYKA